MPELLRSKKFLLAGLSIFLFSFCFAQDKGTLGGLILDKENSQPLFGAIIINSADKTNGAVADTDGRYEIKLNPGKHLLISSFLGMKPDSFSVTIEANQTIPHNFLLELLPAEMGLVVVSASKFEQRLDEVIVSMQIIQPQLIESKNTVNIKSALEQSPGLIILDEEPQIRGGSGFSFGVGSRVATLIDGLPILTGDAGRTDWAFIPTENIEQIEIVEGASSVLFGSSALSGTINFRTKFPKEKSSTYIRTYTGFYSAPKNKEAKWWDGAANFTGLNFSHGMKMKQTDLVIGGQFNYDHNYIGPYVLDGSIPIKADTIDNSDVINKSGRINFNYRYRSAKIEGLSVGLNGNIMTGKSNFSLVWGNDSSGIYRAFPGTMTLTEYTAFYLDPFLVYFTPRGGKHSIRGRWYSTDNNNNNGQENSANVFLGNYEFGKSFKKIGGLSVTGGLYISETYSEANLYAGSGSPKNDLKNRAAYVQLGQKFFKALHVMAGVRGEYFELNGGEEVFKPVFRTGANLEITKSTNLRASYGQGYRYPTIAEKFIITTTGGIYVFPNPEVKPESSWSMEAGVKQGFKIGGFMGYLDFALFHQEFSNTIEYVYAIWAPDSAGFKFVNTGNTRVKGYELSLMGNGKLTNKIELNLLLGYTYVLPQTQNANEVFATDNPADGIIPTELTYVNTSTDTTDNILKYRFRHLFKIDVEAIYKKRFSIGGSMRFYSFMENIDKTFYDLDQPYLLPTGIVEYREVNNSGSMVFDARVGFSINSHFSVSVISNNVANLEYSLRPLKIEAPRTIICQVTAKF